MTASNPRYTQPRELTPDAAPSRAGPRQGKPLFQVPAEPAYVRDFNDASGIHAKLTPKIRHASGHPGITLMPGLHHRYVRGQSPRSRK